MINAGLALIQFAPSLPPFLISAEELPVASWWIAIFSLNSKLIESRQIHFQGCDVFKTLRQKFLFFLFYYRIDEQFFFFFFLWHLRSRNVMKGRGIACNYFCTVLIEGIRAIIFPILFSF